ncbi:MAG TPA: hypothetical protein V6D28_17820 [Leptolyngbyaceae cyanobacterium]
MTRLREPGLVEINALLVPIVVCSLHHLSNAIKIFTTLLISCTQTTFPSEKIKNKKGHWSSVIGHGRVVTNHELLTTTFDK